MLEFYKLQKGAVVSLKTGTNASWVSASSFSENDIKAIESVCQIDIPAIKDLDVRQVIKDKTCIAGSATIPTGTSVIKLSRAVFVFTDNKVISIYNGAIRDIISGMRVFNTSLPPHLALFEGFLIALIDRINVILDTSRDNVDKISKMFINKKADSTIASMNLMKASTDLAADSIAVSNLMEVVNSFIGLIGVVCAADSEHIIEPDNGAVLSYMIHDLQRIYDDLSLLLETMKLLESVVFSYVNIGQNNISGILTKVSTVFATYAVSNEVIGIILKELSVDNMQLWALCGSGMLAIFVHSLLSKKF